MKVSLNETMCEENKAREEEKTKKMYVPVMM